MRKRLRWIMLKRNAKGSQTLEAAIVMPIILCLLLFLLYMGFYYFDRLALQEIGRRGITQLINQRVTERELEKELERYLQFINGVSVEFHETEHGGRLDIRADWTGTKIPLLGMILPKELRASVGMQQISGTDGVRRKEIIDFGE